MSASLPGSSMFSAMIRISLEICLPSLPACSNFWRTFLIMALSSRVSSAGSSSSSRLTWACMILPLSSSEACTWTREMPWTSTRMRPSGSLSMRTIRATVPKS